MYSFKEEEIEKVIVMDKKQYDILNKEWVRETKFGRWFLQSDTWVRYVLDVAIKDFSKILGPQPPAIDKMLDAGCGQGLAFPLLEQSWNPNKIVGIDIDAELLELAEDSAKKCRCGVTLKHAKISESGHQDDYFDMIFCHQLLHHTGGQTQALKEFYRILAPGGILLIGESCRTFINTLPVRLLFKHPADAQKTASEFVDLVKENGFSINDENIKTSTPWWSLSDLGFLKKIGVNTTQGEPTEVLIVARKPTPST